MGNQREPRESGRYGVGGAERVGTVIVGGGQAGLSVGYHLARRDRPFVILDGSQRIGDSWRQRWESLRLFTPARYDGLPGMPFPAPAWSFPTKDEVADYLEAYAARFQLPVRTGVRVDGLFREGDRYVVTAGGRRLEADNVVVASGAFHHPRVPAFAPELDRGIVQLHSSRYQDPSGLPEGEVLVVGAGNSGAEIALEVSRTHRTWLSGRHPGSEPTRPGTVWDRLLTPAMLLVASRMLTMDTRAGRKVRSKMSSLGHPLARVKPKDLAAAGVQRVPPVVGVRDGAPVLGDGRVLDVTSVVWCTGFRPDFGWIDLPVFGPDGEPLQHRGVVEDAPGLYFLSRFFLYALTSSLICGAGRDAEHVAEHIAAREPARPGRFQARASERPGGHEQAHA